MSQVFNCTIKDLLPMSSFNTIEGYVKKLDVVKRFTNSYGNIQEYFVFILKDSEAKIRCVWYGLDISKIHSSFNVGDYISITNFKIQNIKEQFIKDDILYELRLGEESKMKVIKKRNLKLEVSK